MQLHKYKATSLCINRNKMSINLERNIMYCQSNSECSLKENFYGKYIETFEEFEEVVRKIMPNSTQTNVYLCGDLELFNENCKRSLLDEEVFASRNVSFRPVGTMVTNSSEFEKSFPSAKNTYLGMVPTNIMQNNNLGVFFKGLFTDNTYWFRQIASEHKFQDLTESNKEGKAYRKGIYLTNVERRTNVQNEEEYAFNLLRCSTNFVGPTDNFKDVDRRIINQINSVLGSDEKFAHVNHVLAQIYENSEDCKSRIAPHSDKTKDMSENGVIAFCTFYRSYRDEDSNREEFDLKKVRHGCVDPFDLLYKNTSVLSKLHFKLKNCVDSATIEQYNLPSEFDVLLYPNSLFIISLMTNRLYTHEIKPSILPYNMIPTRMGYVARCSNTRAIHKNGQTYVVENDNGKEKLTPLRKIEENDIVELRKLYLEENTTTNVVKYSPTYFSMNEGDYKQPML